MKKNVNNILYAANYYHDVALKKLAMEPFSTGAVVAAVLNAAAGLAIYALITGVINRATRSFNLKDSLVELRSDYKNYMDDYGNDDVIVKDRQYFDRLIEACTNLQELLIKLSKLSTEEQKDPKSLTLIEAVVEYSNKIPPLCARVKLSIANNMGWAGKAMHFMENVGVPAITNSDQLMASIDDVSTYVDATRLEYDNILNDFKKQVVAELPQIDSSNLLNQSTAYNTPTESALGVGGADNAANPANAAIAAITF